MTDTFLIVEEAAKRLAVTPYIWGVAGVAGFVLNQICVEMLHR